MTMLSEEGQKILGEIALRHGVSLAAAEHLLLALISGGTSQAQFNHPDLGGMGQWSQGGMIMVGDMFNHGLKARVDALCNELAQLARNTDLHAPPHNYANHQSQSQGGSHGPVSLFVPSASTGGGWPQELGFPASTGSQNNLRYAFFPATQRLAIDLGGQVSVYDTGDHQIGGFSQQQGSDQSLSFTSQYGLVRLSDLPMVTGSGQHLPPLHSLPEQTYDRQFSAPSAMAEAERGLPQIPVPPELKAAAQSSSQPEEDIFNKIEKLAALHAKGILTDEEFAAKKQELLARI